MVDFPTGVPDIPSANGAAPLATMHGAESHSVSTNRILTNLQALATKLGIGSGGPPSTAALLRRTATGQSAWAQAQPADIAGGGNPNRLLGTVDGTTVSWLQATQPMFSAVTGRGVTLVVAASNASQKVKDAADYVCTGTAATGGDQVQINAALNALPAAGGAVQLSEGTFYVDAAVVTVKQNSVLAGMGTGATTIQAKDNMGAAGSFGLVSLNHAGSVARDFTVNGNKGTGNGAATSMQCFGIGASNCQALRLVLNNSAGIGLVVGSPSTTGVLVRDVLVQGAVSQGVLARSNTGVPLWPTTLIGCTSYANAAGFQSDNGPVIYQGCMAINNTGNGFSLGTDQNQVLDCRAAGNSGIGIVVTAGLYNQVIGCRAYGNNSAGIQLNGTHGLVGGCHVQGNGSYGIHLNAQYCAAYGNEIVGNVTHGLLLQVANTSAVGNTLIGNGTGGAVYGQLYLSAADNAFVEGNTIRRAGNATPDYGLVVVSSTNAFIGLNDAYDGGSAGPISDGGTNTRRVSKLKAETILTGSPLNGTMTQNVWYDCCSDLTFYVSSPQSLITLISGGYAQAGNTGAALYGIYQVRFLIDGSASVYFSGTVIPQANVITVLPLAGMSIRTGLSVGSHTVRVQVASISSTANGYLRTGTEFFYLQVREDIP